MTDRYASSLRSFSPQIALVLGIHSCPALALEGFCKVDRVLHCAVDAPLGRTVGVGADLSDNGLGPLFAAPGASVRNKEELLGREGLEAWELEVFESRRGESTNGLMVG